MTREEAIVDIRDNIKPVVGGKSLDMAIEALEQEPKTGHWKRISIDKYVQHAMAYYRCSECGEDIIGEHRYCPNCGAKMFEPQERSVKE